MARTSIGPYLITGVLGQGGMGVVFAAVHTQIKRRVAIKLLRPEYASNADTVARFFHEALAVNVIEHPGLVQVYDHGHLADGSTYLVMEYLHGETLTDRLKHHQKPMSEAAAVSMALQLASALEAAHSHGIVHRDLKPANIMLVADPAMPDGERVKLLDFGIAKLADGVAESNKPRTRAGMILGTPTYMAPEQCRALSDIDGKADVYALGVVLYQLLSGRLPFVGEKGEDEFDVMAKHMTKPPPPLGNLDPKLPTPLVFLVHRMLEKARGSRPTMGEVFAELKRIRDERLSKLSSVRNEGPPAVGAVPVQPILASAVPSQHAEIVASIEGPTLNNQANATKVSKGLARRRINTDNRPADPVPAVPYVRKRARMMMLPIIVGAVPTSPGVAPSTMVPEPSTLTLQTRRRWGILAGGVVITLLLSTYTLVVKRPEILRKWRSAPSLSTSDPALAPGSIRTESLGADKASSRAEADAAPSLRPVPVQDPAPPVVPIQPSVLPSTSNRPLELLPPLRVDAEPQQTKCELATTKAYKLKEGGQHSAAYHAFGMAYLLCQDPFLIAERGRSMQLTGELDKAVQLYQEYLAKASASDGQRKAGIQVRLQETLAEIEKQKHENSLARDTGSVERELVNQPKDEAEQAPEVVQKPKLPVEQPVLHNVEQEPKPSIEQPVLHNPFAK